MTLDVLLHGMSSEAIKSKRPKAWLYVRFGKMDIPRVCRFFYPNLGHGKPIMQNISILYFALFRIFALDKSYSIIN